MRRTITGFHQDELGHWVADLDCGHGQHVRHEPPWQERPWVLSEAGRAARLGEALECLKCERPEPVPVPTSRATAPHYAWGDGADGWHLVRHDLLSVIEERMPPGTSEVRHWHARARQFFYVLRGRLVIEFPHGPVELSAGTGCEVPPGTEHQVLNRGPDPADFLVVSQPSSHGDRHTGPRPDARPDR